MGLLHCCLSSSPSPSCEGTLSSASDLSTLSSCIEDGSSVVELYEEECASEAYQAEGRDSINSFQSLQPKLQTLSVLFSLSEAPFLPFIPWFTKSTSG